jgi:hypothetical protein
MTKSLKLFSLFLLVLLLATCSLRKEISQQTLAVPDLAELQQMTARFAPTEFRVDTSGLSQGDLKALAKLIEAGRVIDDIFLTQLWSGNHALYAELKKDQTPLGRARLHYFWINKSPWSELDGGKAFLAGVPEHKLPGANFYPEDLTKGAFESWEKALSPEQREQAEGFFTVVRRGADGQLTLVPYSEEYQQRLQQAAQLLREAAELTDNATLKKFLSARADAFLSNDYYASDIAWMDLDAPLDITIGPYETYNDELFGYKAAFEAYINLRDDQETTRLKVFGQHLQEIENNLPIDPKYRNPKLGALAPIRVVNEIFGAGDGNHAVQTTAYNLPNDERVIQQKGSKRVMMKNVQEAKFERALVPISQRTLSQAAQADVDFESFFTHTLAHELSHGLGPHNIRVNDRDTTVRQELKELYSAIEEAKADITGLFLLQYLMDHGKMPGVAKREVEAAKRRLYTTFLASSFRSLRFGIKEAHGRGMALQVSYLIDKGAFTTQPDGTFGVDFSKMDAAVRDLTHDLLTLEATGDYAGAKKMLDELAVVRPPVQKALDSLKDIPTDIEPQFVTANEVAPAPSPY